MTHLEPSGTTISNNGPLGDWELVTLAQAGDRDAFGQLYSRHVSTVYRYISWRLAYGNDTEQLTSQVFLRALQRIDSVTNIGKDFPAWLVTIARNIVFDYTKSATYQRTRTYADLPEQRAHEDPEAQTVGLFHTRFLGQQLTPALRKLSRDQQECVGLRFYAGLSVTETAAAMARDEGAVKALQHRAIRRLADLLPDDAPSWLRADAGVTEVGP
jgi:RNA polymerase sigma-70 factor (ECF subfamily)